MIKDHKLRKFALLTRTRETSEEITKICDKYNVGYIDYTHDGKWWIDQWCPNSFFYFIKIALLPEENYSSFWEEIKRNKLIRICSNN